jgi:phosphohistidine phosphatase
MTCYLVRHGEAKPEAEDPQRPLTEHGESQVEKVARAALARGIRAAEIWHSDKLRAKQTAEILARHLSSPNSLREVSGLAPEDDPILAQAELEAAVDQVMVVGHLPHLSRLASLLISGDPEKRRIDFPTAAIVCLQREADQWKIEWILAPDRA